MGENKIKIHGSAHTEGGSRWDNTEADTVDRHAHGSRTAVLDANKASQSEDFRMLGREESGLYMVVERTHSRAPLPWSY